MQYQVDGKPVAEISPLRMRALRLSEEQPTAEAVVVAASVAIRRFKTILKILFGVLGGFVALVCIAAIAADPEDWEVIVPVALAAVAFIVWFLPFSYRRNVAKFTARMDHTALPAAPGSKILVDEFGLTIAAQSFPWSELAIDAVGFATVLEGADGASHLVLSSLGLTAAGKTIQLDANTLSTGSRVLDMLYRRLAPAEAQRRF